MSTLCWLLALGAVWRATLLVTADEITRPAREAMLRRWDEPTTDRAARRGDRWAYLLSCPWCASPHIAVVVIGTGLAWGDGWFWQLGAGTLTASALTGFLASFASPDG